MEKMRRGRAKEVLIWCQKNEVVKTTREKKEDVIIGFF